MMKQKSGRIIEKLFVIAAILVLIASIFYVMFPFSNRKFYLFIIGLSKGRIESYLAKFPPYKGQTVGGIAYLKTKLDELVKEVEKDAYCIVSLGSEISGSAEAYYSRGEIPIKLLNHLNLSCMLVGNIEFTFGKERLEELAKIANFPFLSSNIRIVGNKERPSWVSSEVIINCSNRFKVGILGITSPQTPILTSKANVSGLSFLCLSEFLVENVKSLREYGVDLVILLTQYDKAKISEQEWQDIVLARPDIVVMLDYDVEYIPPYEKDGIIIKTISGYNQTKEIDYLMIEYPAFGSKPIAWNSKRISIISDQIQPDAYMTELIAKLTSDLENTKTEVICNFASDYKREYYGECPIGNLIADIIRFSTNSDLAFMNSGGIQSDIKAGKFTVGDLFALLPFDNQIVTMNLTGEEILEILSVSASLKKGVLQISGGSYSFVNYNSEDYALKDVKIGNEVINKNKIYKVSTNSFLAEGGDGYLAFKKGRGIEYGSLLREEVKNFLKKLSASGPIILTNENRIVRENNK